MKTEIGSQSNTLETSAKKANNSSYSELVEPVKNTPFTIVTVEGGYFLAMGKYRLTELLKTKEEAIEAGRDESWWRIMQVMQLMMEEHDRTKEEKTKYPLGKEGIATPEEAVQNEYVGVKKTKENTI